MNSIAGILLAAGSSERFESDKLLAMLPEGERLIERALRVHLQSQIYPLTVVASPQLTRTMMEQPEILSVSKLVVGENFHGWFTFSCQWGRGRLVANENPERGMSSSIHAGLNCLKEEEKACGVLISLADLPFLTPETINTLIGEFLDERVGLLLPVFKNRTGHPVIVDVNRFRDRINQIEGDVGLRAIIERHPDQVRRIPWHNDSVIRDIDTPADLERLIPHD